MIEPCVTAGLTPVFYDVTPELEPSIADLRRKADDKTLAIVATHFFAKLYDFTEISGICKDLSCTFVVDYAHVDLCGEGVKIGTQNQGDVALCCPRKFYGVFDGAFLDSELEIKRPRHSLRDELRSLKNLLERFVDSPVHSVTPSSGTVTTARQDSDYVDARFDARDPVATTLLSRLILRCSDNDKCQIARQMNYRIIDEEIDTMARCQRLYADRTIPATPYVYPLLLTNPEQDHAAIRASNIDVWRWEDLYASECQIASEYESRLIQLPCHQGMTAQNTRAMCESLRNVLS
jgi:dTDP-4-amino-4,6-dideoxygalactose transaminase